MRKVMCKFNHFKVKNGKTHMAKQKGGTNCPRTAKTEQKLLKIVFFVLNNNLKGIKL